MTIKDVENYWLEDAENAFSTTKILFKKKKYTESMFFLHLAVEKMLKGLFVNRLKIEAPWGHNLQLIASKINGIQVPEWIMILLGEITTFNTKARYDDYKKNFYQLCNKKFAGNYINQSKELLSWLRSQVK